MAPPRKRRSRRQGSGGPRDLQLVQTEKPKAPAAPKGLSKASRDRWKNFWDSDLALYVDPGADLHRLQRWIKDVDEFETLRETYDKAPTVEGSKGQPRLNPIASRLAQLERQIERAEEQFGMTPAARLKLGINLGGDKPKSAEDLNRMIRDRRLRDGNEDEEPIEDEEVAEGFQRA